MAFFSTIQPIEKMDFTKSVSATTPVAPMSPVSNFADILKQSMADYAKLEQVTAQDSKALALGTAQDLTQIQINAMKAEAALQTTVQLTTRTVNAYKEIMQMQI